jgi:hypothetical protein
MSERPVLVIDFMFLRRISLWTPPALTNVSPEPDSLAIRPVTDLAVFSRLQNTVQKLAKTSRFGSRI